MGQGTLFDTGGGLNAYGRPMSPPTNGTITSGKAADSVKGITGELRRRVYEHIAACGEHGSTDEEGQDALLMEGNTWRPRRTEIRTLGLIRDSGKTRRTSAGRSAVVWVASQFATGESA